jgi:lipopolysaccharide exporter
LPFVVNPTRLLTSPARRGIAVLGSARLVSEAARVGKLLILARLLGPDDFGIAAVALLAINTIDLFTQTGFDVALIQRRADIRPQLNAVLGLQILRGAVLAALIVLSAPHVAAFFNISESANVIALTAALVFLKGLMNPAIALLSRRLRFGGLAAITTSEAVVAMVASVLIALATPTASALVIGTIIGQLTRTVLSYVLVDVRPRPVFRPGELRELMHFGKWVQAANVIVFLSLNADTAFVGRVFGAGELGLYQMAFRVSDAVFGGVSAIVGQVALPVLSRASDDRDVFRSRYGVIVRRTGAALLVAAVVLFACAEWGTEALLGPEWHALVPTLRILVLANFLRSVWAIAAWGLVAAGYPRFNFTANAVRLIAFAALVWPLSRLYGIEGVAVSVLIAVCAGSGLHLRRAKDHLGIAMYEHFVPPRRKPSG